MKTMETNREKVMCNSCDKPITGEVTEVGNMKPFSKVKTYQYFHATPRECAEAADIHVILSRRKDIWGQKLA